MKKSEVIITTYKDPSARSHLAKATMCRLILRVSEMKFHFLKRPQWTVTGERAKTTNGEIGPVPCQNCEI